MIIRSVIASVGSASFNAHCTIINQSTKPQLFKFTVILSSVTALQLHKNSSQVILGVFQTLVHIVHLGLELLGDVAEEGTR